MVAATMPGTAATVSGTIARRLEPGRPDGVSVWVVVMHRGFVSRRLFGNCIIARTAPDIRVPAHG